MFDFGRRDFLKTAALAGVATAAAELSADCVTGESGAMMQGFRVDPIRHLRVGVVGLGKRGQGGLHRLSDIPGVEVAAICDLYVERVQEQREWLKEHKKPAAREYVGPESFKALCESELDAVYVVTSWATHVPIALYAMEHGKHVFIEVPAATRLDECWALVETAERTRRHCMQLENCCYGEAEMLCLSMARQGVFGELVHGEGAYIHDLREGCYSCWDHMIRPGSTGLRGYTDYWRLMHNAVHKGNQYETHGLGPICQYMNINRGDRIERLVSLESDQFNYEAYARAKFSAANWRNRLPIAMGDMNMTVLKTAKGRSILVEHDVSSPRPYSRHNVLTGTKGAFSGIYFFDKVEDAFENGCPCHFGWEENPGESVHKWFDFEKTKAMREKYRHPLWRDAGEFAKKVGGHGGMDFLMDLRWCYCLQNGLPLDTDVYDLATWCSLGELTERSVRRGNEPMELPDFTRGGWKTAKPLGLETVDLTKMGLELDKVQADSSALNV